ncbi:hypothetical protein F4678DRAFT_456180 [Xylaria arbuscula]|nr:hypothetical protein F4678DRAFT_456180 [Xylaria arbuscula]
MSSGRRTRTPLPPSRFTSNHSSCRRSASPPPHEYFSRAASLHPAFLAAEATSSAKIVAIPICRGTSSLRKTDRGSAGHSSNACSELPFVYDILAHSIDDDRHYLLQACYVSNSSIERKKRRTPAKKTRLTMSPWTYCPILFIALKKAIIASSSRDNWRRNPEGNVLSPILGVTMPAIALLTSYSAATAWKRLNTGAASENSSYVSFPPPQGPSIFKVLYPEFQRLRIKIASVFTRRSPVAETAAPDPAECPQNRGSGVWKLVPDTNGQQHYTANTRPIKDNVVSIAYPDSGSCISTILHKPLNDRSDEFEHPTNDVDKPSDEDEDGIARAAGDTAIRAKER